MAYSILVLISFHCSTTVIGRDRDGNDVMADGSIKLKATSLNLEQTQNCVSFKQSTIENQIESRGFDITACVGSPEKPPSVDENISPINIADPTLLETPSIVNPKCSSNKNKIEDVLVDPLVPVEKADY